MNKKKILGDKIDRVFLTGGAGFIGSHVVEILLAQGYWVTVFDNLSNGRMEYVRQHMSHAKFRFYQSDVLDTQQLVARMKGHDLVWHLAANTDIIGSHEKPTRDLRDCAMATVNVLEAMRALGLKEILFSSTGAVYGDICQEQVVSENVGPLLPVSTYGAGKIASEAFISAYCSVYGLRAWIYRFGNVIGARMTHGVIFDFINKFKKNPKELLIQGDGRQEKNYFLVEECIHGMGFGYRHIPMPDEKPCDIFNLGTTTVSKVTYIADVVREEMGLTDAKIVIEGARKAWPGDQPRVHFTVDRINALGWKTKLSSDESVRVAVRRMLGKESELLPLTD